MISKMNSNETHLSVYWVHNYEWFQQWTQLKTMYQSIEFIPMKNPNEKPMYQSIEFITMNDCSSEPKWFAIASLYPASVVETRFYQWINDSNICYWEERRLLEVQLNLLASDSKELPCSVDFLKTDSEVPQLFFSGVEIWQAFVNL